MNAIPYSTELQLAWTQLDSHKPSYILSTNREEVGSLTWSKSMGTLADARVAGRHWTLKREGFWKPYVTVRQAGRNANIVVAELQWLRDTRLVFGDGRSFVLCLINMWRQEWMIKTADGQAILRFNPTHTPEGMTSPVQVLALEDDPEILTILVLLGWYLLVSLYSSSDDAATTAAITATLS